MKQIYFILILLTAQFSFSQGYELGLVHNTDYSFKIVAIPDFDSSGNTDISDVGFTLMLPAGIADAENALTLLPGRNWDISQFDAAFLSGIGLGDGTLDAFQFNMPAGQSLVAHTSGQMIDLVSFDVSNMPTTGTMYFLLNTDPIAQGAGGVLDSFYNSNIDNTTTQDYFNGISPGLESFNFSTLSIEPVENHLTEIKIYPNPTSSFIHIRSDKVIDQVKILDMTGKQVMEFMGSSRLDLRQLSAGTYFLQLQSHNTVVVKKIIIQ